jgi:transcriptional regulator with XRE-family HTH domain
MAGKRKRLAQRRKACGHTQETFAEALRVDRTTVQRWEGGEVDPQPHQRPRMAKVLQVSPDELETLLKADESQLISARLPELNGERGQGFAQIIRDMSERLIILDNEMNGLPIADVAARAYKAVHRRIGEGAYDRKGERDIQAAAAELAEIAGWALFNAGKFSASRRFNQEALFLTKLCGDRSIELITLQNQAMLSGWSGRPREELAIARSVLGSGRLTPRVEAIFRAREAQGLAGSGYESESAKTFKRARSLLEESAPEGTPHWAWWITDRELDRQQGRALQESGNVRQAIPILQSAMAEAPGAHVGYRNVAAVRLLVCLLEEQSWQLAEEEALRLVPAVGEMSSTVSLKLLSAIARRGADLPGAPMGVRDALHGLSDALDDDPYAL